MNRTVRALLGRAAIPVSLATVLASCNDDPAPTAPGAVEDPDSTELEAPPQEAAPGPGIFNERAHALDRQSFDLLSGDAEVEEGLYRFRSLGGDVPDVARDDFIVTEGADGEPTVRRVITAELQGEELILDTGPAYWHEIVNGGRYEFTIPLDGGPAQIGGFGPSAAPISISSEASRLPPLEYEFDELDVCQWISDFAASLPGGIDPNICGTPQSQSFGSGVTVSIEGTLDSLKVLEGRVRLTGETQAILDIESGGLQGGELPVFYPCNEAAYLGCLSTPTGAALIEFIRAFAPSIPELSLPPVRICIPGTPVRTQRGYWSGLIYHLPVFVACGIQSIGKLPTVTIPHIEAITSEIRPHVRGDMTVRVTGDGQIGLKLAIPGMAVSFAYPETRSLKLEAFAGLFVEASMKLLNAGATVRFVFDEKGVSRQIWSPGLTGGWSTEYTSTDRANSAEFLDITNPDSIVVRVGAPIEASYKACVAIKGCKEGSDTIKVAENEFVDFLSGLLKVELEGGVRASIFNEATYTREQIHPTDPEIDNWHVSVETAYDLRVWNKIEVPGSAFIEPELPNFDETFECCRVPVSDYWGQGRIEVRTSTSGVDVDPDGYTVLVERADDDVQVLDPGTTDLSDWPHRVHSQPVGVDGTTTFGYPSLVPCIGVYSDRLIAGVPLFGLAVAGARALGVDIPTYGITSPCEWLVGRYEVRLTGVAANCTVAGGPLRDDVWLYSGRLRPLRDNIRRVAFDVACTSTVDQGSLEVISPVQARDPDAPPYLLLDGVVTAVFEPTDTVRREGLPTGTHTVTIEGLLPYCDSAPADVLIVAGETASVELTATCTVPPVGDGSVRYAASAVGDSVDATGYVLAVNGFGVGNLHPDGFLDAENVPVGVPTVFAVTDIAGNCRTDVLNPQVITLSSTAGVEVPFPVTCVDARPDTIVGTVDASGWPVRTVTIRGTDGTTLVVNGAKKDELERLSGSPVRVWGETSATGIHVHGYDLRSVLGDDRWLGIVMYDPLLDETWLYGEEAVELVDAPVTLRTQSESLVWIMGREVADGVQPTLFGVIRSGS